MKKILILSFSALLLFSLIGCGPNSPVTTSSSTEVGLTLDNFVFCESVNGERDYVERTNKTFKPGEEAYVYFEVSGFKYKKDDGTVTYHPIIDAVVKDYDGNIVIPRETIIDTDLTGDNPVDYLYFYFYIPTDDMKDGKYTLTVEVKDNFGSGHLRTNQQFIIKD